MHALPLAIVYLTDRCNSRCVMCDYWKYGQRNISIEQAQLLASQLDNLQTKQVLLSGGEPLLHPQWDEIARTLGAGRRELWLLTAGLALKKYASTAAELCSTITVSLDGASASTYQSIRGLDAFDKVCAGVRAVVARGVRTTLRCTVQRRNFRELPALVDLAHELGVSQISFLAVDVLTHAAFARQEDIKNDLALEPAELDTFDDILDDLSTGYAGDFASGFIAESPAKLHRLRRYFAALHGLDEFPAVRCNAPRFSAVFGADGAIQPCFFISSDGHHDLNDPRLRTLRKDIRRGARNECKTCVCSMHRGVDAFIRGDS